MSKMSQLYLDIQEEIINSKSTVYDPNCSECIANYKQFYTQHYASSDCESGKRNHCTCDICF